jgi:streptomycin 6-kinase
MNKILSENLPPKFRQNVIGLYGAKGEKWLSDLPQMLEKTCTKWNLTLEDYFPNLSFNFVAKCSDKNGEKYVLKVGVPDEDSPLLTEKRALEAFDGQGAVKVLRYDDKLCAMLLERANSGKILSEVCGEDYLKAVDIAIEVLKKLPRNPPNKTQFINLETWIDGLNSAVTEKFAPEKVAKAQEFFAALIEPFERKILLHGDVHFDNILSAKREPFLLIDPKGLIGEIGYEIAVFLNDLAGWTEHLANRKTILDKAIKRFSKEFAVSEQNLRKWCFAFAVLSAWWMMEDFGENCEKTLALADIWDV